jgi:alpha-tubulin suppressor-like RCC1 family protein
MLLTYDKRLFALTKDEGKVVTTKDLQILMASNQPIKFTYASAFKNMRVKQISIGMSHMVALTHEGQVMGLGNNEYG